MHKELLCDRSEFFRAACNGNFKEAEGVVKLPEQDPATFKHFIYWLYTENIRGYFYPRSIDPSIKELKRLILARMNITCLNERHLHGESHKAKEASTALDEANYRDLPFTALISLYILADSLLIRGLKDTIITLLIEVYGYDRLAGTPKGTTLDFWMAPGERIPSIPSPAAGINLAWKKTPKNCPLRSVLLALFCDNIDCAYSLEQFDDAGFLSEAVLMLLDRWMSSAGTSDWGAKGTICEFHVHDVQCPLKDKVQEGYCQACSLSVSIPSITSLCRLQFLDTMSKNTSSTTWHYSCISKKWCPNTSHS